MKNFALVMCLFLFIPFNAFSEEPYVTSRMSLGVVGGGVSAVCSTTGTANLLREGFVGTGFENAGWTEDAAGDPDPDYNISGLGTPPSQVCSEGLRINVPESTPTYSRWDKGSTLTTNKFTMTLDIYIPATTTFDANGFVAGGSTDPASLVSFRMAIYVSGGIWYIKGAGSVTSAAVALNASAWNQIIAVVDYGAGAGGSNISANGGASQTFTAFSSLPRYFFAGITGNVGVGEAADFAVGRYMINDDN